MEHTRPVDHLIGNEGASIEQYDDGAHHEIGGTQVFSGKKRVALGTCLGKFVPEAIAQPQVKECNPADN